MNTLSEIRQELYKYNFSVVSSDYGIDLKNWMRHPYTCLKSRFYLEMSSILVYLLMRTRIHPNTVTLAYAFCGIIGGVLLSIPQNVTIVTAICIFFSKGILDWSDGALARATNRTSVTGAVLDPWGAVINSLGFQVGLGFYVAAHSGNIIYFYLAAVLMALRAGDLRTRTYHYFGSQLVNGNIGHARVQAPGPEMSDASNSKPLVDEGFPRLKDFIINFLDDRARTVDFVCFLIVMEIIFPGFFVTWLIIWALTAKYLLVFLAGIYLAFRKNWIENTGKFYNF